MAVNVLTPLRLLTIIFFKHIYAFITLRIAIKINLPIYHLIFRPCLNEPLLNHSRTIKYADHSRSRLRFTCRCYISLAGNRRVAHLDHGPAAILSRGCGSKVVRPNLGLIHPSDSLKSRSR